MFMASSENVGINMALSLNLADERHERNRLHATAAEDPSERIKQCIAFLFTIASIEVVDTIKNGHGDTCYVINVVLIDASAQQKIVGGAAETTSFQIERTVQEFKTMHYAVTHWASKPASDDCSYCRYFRHCSVPGTLARLVGSKVKLEKRVGEFLNGYVSHARLPRPTDRLCQGFEHIPSIVTRFIAKDLPQTESAV